MALDKVLQLERTFSCSCYFRQLRYWYITPTVLPCHFFKIPIQLFLRSAGDEPDVLQWISNSTEPPQWGTYSEASTQDTGRQDYSIYSCPRTSYPLNYPQPIFTLCKIALVRRTQNPVSEVGWASRG